MNKKQKRFMDRKLIEACVLEKWNPRAMGCEVTDYSDLPEVSTCVLCQVYHKKHCRGCPVRKNTNANHCERTPFTKYRLCKVEQMEEEIEFLISLLPKKHPWRNI
jgi:hypothetical protein